MEKQAFFKDCHFLHEFAFAYARKRLKCRHFLKAEELNIWRKLTAYACATCLTIFVLLLRFRHWCLCEFAGIENEISIYTKLAPAQGLYVPSILHIEVPGYVVLAMRAFGRSAGSYNNSMEPQGFLEKLYQNSDGTGAALHECVSKAAQRIHELGTWAG